MSPRILLFATMLTASLLGTSCGKDCEPTPEPVAATPIQAATLHVFFEYAGSADGRSVSYLADKPTGQLASDRLTLTLNNMFPAVGPSDKVVFVLAKSQQKPGLVGTYSLASQPDASKGDVQTTFFRYSSIKENTDNYVASNLNQLSGSLVITAYDAARQLISGTYEIKAAGIRDVFTFRPNFDSNPDSRRLGNLRVHGSFQEIPLLP